MQNTFHGGRRGHEHSTGMPLRTSSDVKFYGQDQPVCRVAL